ncbi:glycosyltransferase family 4 protein [Pseudomonas sp.]|uniref:glycosyltransferase family 4 protein n=1 Tax=unclassified Pseudomonas TaxID=196821 RepID=UPI0031E18532
MSRILLITRNLPPLLGGMERLNWHLIDELRRANDVQVIGPDDAASLAPAGVTFQPVPLRPTWRFLIQAMLAAVQTARRWRPHAVLAGSGLTAPIALLAARLCGARAVVYIHGLDITTRHPLYRALWLPAIRGMDAVICNSHSTWNFALEAGVKEERLALVYPGAKTPIPQRPPEVLAAFRAKHGLAERPVLLSVGRLTSRKGLLEFVQQGLPKVVAQRPDTVLVIVGDAPKDALHAHAHAQTRESILEAAQHAGIGDAVRFIGAITDLDELCTAYQAADVHVFPVRSIPGDTEGFGMVAIEAAVNALPTVAFATGGIVDAVADGVSGYLVPPHDYTELASRIVQVLEKPGALRTGCREHGQKFSWERFGTKIRDVLIPGSSTAFVADVNQAP